MRTPDRESLERLKDHLLVLLGRRSRQRTLRQLILGLIDFYKHDLRWSYLMVAGLVVVCLIVSFLFEDGWTVWPFAMVVSIMSMIHEAAERNGQGVPPLHAYALFIGFVVVWAAVAFLCSILNPAILALALCAVGYQCAKGYIQEQQRNEVIAKRRDDGCCIFCGAKTQAGHVYCVNCGEEPDPVLTRLHRVAAIVESRKNSSQARALLTPKPPTAGIAAKERALLDRRNRQRPRK